MKKTIYSLFTAIFLIPSAYGQDINNAELRKQLQVGETVDLGRAPDGLSQEDGYRSFVQNEYNNLVKQIKDLSTDEMSEMNLAELTEERMKLAIDLCLKDPRACFLIEAY